MTSKTTLDKTSKFLSFILRHNPDSIDLTLDENGWANINELINRTNLSGELKNLNRSLIEEVVTTNDKKRFSISKNGENIRANQGHSINVDLQLKPKEPPEFLYHGTATRFLDSILCEGLKPQQRQHVHLSTDIETATKVGQRYGKPVILKIKAKSMYKKGFVFYHSKNGVWLIDYVPTFYINLET